MNELATTTDQLPIPSVAQMLSAVIAGGITNDNVGTLEKMVGLYERMEMKNAEKEFAAAFVALQAEMPKVHAANPVPNNDGTIRYCFAAYEDIMKQVAPLLQRHGFTVTFSTDFNDIRLIKTCTLQHVGGHSKSNQFAVRIGKGPPGSSESQGDGAASTYAKRFALCDALNIVIDKDTDAAAEGDPSKMISQRQADALRERVRAVGSKDENFLKFASAASYEEIAESKYAMLDDFLLRKAAKPL